ncbi:D-xylulose kinase [Dacryopinax primogenitus]|uniref:Xylulose kinase n=1 Tax=Dacryopinax primogenitus (strain DJM 731) TaxID=1858805 RepID=M5G5L4_DACPD|nr:D-xylulose kinase [Dacryopinax primogenitus]EJU03510.1 D-xylulose kinase [Dacryopinax primogenitus]
MSSTGPWYLGLDLSTQQLKISIADDNEDLVLEHAVHFDRDLPQYGTKNGAVRGPEPGEMLCPVAVWIEAVDFLMDGLKKEGVDLHRIAGVSGAAQQHGSVYWTQEAEQLLESLDPGKTLTEQLGKALSQPTAPTWQDSSTTKECRQLEEYVGGAQKLADITGSRAYERFTASQIEKVWKKKPEVYAKTGYISLVSSFLASLFLCSIAPIEVSDASGMNLMDIETNKWDEKLLEASGGKELRAKLKGEPVPGGTVLGKVGKWWVDRYGLNPDCIVAPFTGDNPSSIVSLSSPGDAILSLGTSTTFLVSVPPLGTLPARTTTSHLLAHPTAPGGSIIMLCYKNGALTREQVRDRHAHGSWSTFNAQVLETPTGNNGYSGFYFPLPEIIPDGVQGDFFYKDGNPIESIPENAHSRAVLESQLLSILARLKDIMPKDSAPLSRLVVTGGSSANPVIQQISADILNLPAYIANTSASATVGGGFLAKFALWKQSHTGTFEQMRLQDVHDQFTKAAEPDPVAVKTYHELLPTYRSCEAQVVKACAAKRV